MNMLLENALTIENSKSMKFIYIYVYIYLYMPAITNSIPIVL